MKSCPKYMTSHTMNSFPASKNRTVGNPSIFSSNDSAKWEKMYDEIMDPKYKKGTRKFSRNFGGIKWPGEEEPPIYLIPRSRGGPSYKEVDLEGANPSDLMYGCISKGFPMQDVSSFTLGPIVGEGLCLVNAAFSKIICVHHIEGGGVVDLSRKDFWKRGRKPIREIVLLPKNMMRVDGQVVYRKKWLANNEMLWLAEWEKWRKSVALCSMGDFHWDDASPTISFRRKGKYIDFVEWKRECYVRPSYELLPNTGVFQYLLYAWKTERRALGLVHPKARKNCAEKPMTREMIKELMDSKDCMVCQPYVVVGLLMGVPID